MGGRGSRSATVNGNTVQINIGDLGSNANVTLIDNTPDSRSDVQNLFVNELGVKSVGGTDAFNTAVIGAIGIQLKNLEREYGAIGASRDVEIVTMMDGGTAKAAVGANDLTGYQALYLNPKYLGNITKYNRSLGAEQKSGYKMPTDGSVKNQARYTITHEYGHMLQNAMYRKAVQNGYNGTKGDYAKSVANSISKTAVSKYGGTQKSLSSYGATNSAEFFAEAFANANLGRSNAIGKAMNDWLKNNKL